MDLAKSKAVEGEPDNLICRRHEKRPKKGERPAKEMWAEPERRGAVLALLDRNWGRVERLVSDLLEEPTLEGVALHRALEKEG